KINLVEGYQRHCSVKGLRMTGADVSGKERNTILQNMNICSTGIKGCKGRSNRKRAVSRSRPHKMAEVATRGAGVKCRRVCRHDSLLIVVGIIKIAWRETPDLISIAVDRPICIKIQSGRKR